MVFKEKIDVALLKNYVHTEGSRLNLFGRK
jgi:hypothetical protein